MGRSDGGWPQAGGGIDVGRVSCLAADVPRRGIAGPLVAVRAALDLPRRAHRLSDTLTRSVSEAKWRRCFAYAFGLVLRIGSADFAGRQDEDLAVSHPSCASDLDDPADDLFGP